MRLISGKLGRRALKTDSRMNYRPVTEMVRSAIFSTLASSFDLGNCRVLDLYAGTGALGFEAISRGCASVEFVENNVKHADLLRENSRILRVEDQVKISQVDVFTFLRSCSGQCKEPKYDLIFADPPYGNHPGDELLKSLLSSCLAKVGSRLVIDGMIGLELEDVLTLDGVANSFHKDKCKRYGDTIVFYYSVLKL